MILSGNHDSHESMIENGLNLIYLSIQSLLSTSSNEYFCKVVYFNIMNNLS